MTPARPASGFRKGIGLVLAAIVAPVLTSMCLVLMPFISPFEFLANKGAVEIFQFLPVIGLFAVIFGFLGALLFLGIAFRLVSGARDTMTYVLAGAGAGLAHCAVGFLLRLAADAPGTGGVGNNVLDAVIMWGGFLLMMLTNPMHIYVVIACAAVAGALAGWIYSRFARTSY